VQINNIHLIRGMLGKPGCGLLQIERTTHHTEHPRVRDDGDMAGFRNWANDAYTAELAVTQDSAADALGERHAERAVTASPDGNRPDDSPASTA
jgi:hypothetical protein